MSTYTPKGFLLRSILFMAIFCLACSGCGGGQLPEKTALRINSYTLSVAEFDELFFTLDGIDDTPLTREAFLENLINRKLLLQEAQRQGLDRQKDFLKSIENFWEQSLLTIVIDKKTKEISTSIVVNEKEIQDYYIAMVRMYPDAQMELDYKLRNTIRLQLLKQKQSEVIDSWAEKLKNTADIEVDKEALGLE